MHDIDRTYTESNGFEFGDERLGEEYGQDERFEDPFGEMEQGDYGEGEGDFEFENDEFESEGEEEGPPFDEGEEMELAAELLSVSDEDELDQFLGSLIKKVGRSVGRIIKSPVGRVLGGLLKGAVKKALPIAGGAVGGLFGGPMGAAIGGGLASKAGQVFGLETEGMSEEDQQFETARRYVRFAGSAARNAAFAPPMIPPHVAARKAVITSARRHAPGLLIGRQGYRGGGSNVPRGTIASGRWFRVRRNNRTYIILRGV